MYVKNTPEWENKPAKTTPVSADRLNHMETQYDEAIAAVPGAVASALLAQGNGTPMGSGLYADRPAAGSVPVGFLYLATNVPEVYRSTGAAWVVISSGGNEIGSATLTTPPATSTSGTPVDVAGLTSTFVVGERPIELRFDGQVKTSSASVAVVVYLVLDGVQKSSTSINGLAADKFFSLSRRVRVGGLTPGSTHTAKIQWAGGGTMTMDASATSPAELSVVTL